MTTLEDRFSAYSKWRNTAAERIVRLRAWLEQGGLADAQMQQRMLQVLERLRDDQLVVAFVAEFSRGKSELINALFFSGYEDRVLPSSTGRTTMCPTELQWPEGASPSLRLLPIDTRARPDSIADLKRIADEWTTIPLATDSVAALQEPLSRLSETRLATQAEAQSLGFTIDPHGVTGLKPDSVGTVEIPRWRHAIVQFPHPLLAQGLVVLDTPGLNAIGAEPELTLSLLPSAHAILFILGVDTGVTQSDLAVWRDYVHGGAVRRRGRLVVLNKIDSMWDGLRDDARIEAELARQVEQVSRTLEVDPELVFPVSAQKALVARIGRDDGLLVRSRLPLLERALSDDLLLAKRDIVRDNTAGEIAEIARQARSLLETRQGALRAQREELDELKGKNQSVIEYMMRKIRSEKEEFESGLQKYYAVRTVFTDLTNHLLAHLGLDALREETRRTREAMLESTFSQGLRDAMEGFFAHLYANLANSAEEIVEIGKMLEVMYKRFSVEHGLRLAAPPVFSVHPYVAEVETLEEDFNRQMNTALILLTTEKHTLTQKFFETVALQARRIFEVANRDVELWLRAVMAPLETQVREHQVQLKRRLESVKRIHEATDTIAERHEELLAAEQNFARQIDALDTLEREVGLALGREA